MTRRELTRLRDAGIDLATLSAGEAGRPIVPVDAGESLEAARESLRRQEVGRLPVVEDGRELGIVTRADILGYLGARRELGPRVRGLVRKVSPDDEMFEESFWSYVGFVGSALECVGRAQEAAGRESFESILDFACGHGRVLRVLKAAYPDARLAACDINEDGVRFCAGAFGATPFLSREDPEKIELDDREDEQAPGREHRPEEPEKWPPAIGPDVCEERAAPEQSSADTRRRASDTRTTRDGPTTGSRSALPNGSAG